MYSGTTNKTQNHDIQSFAKFRTNLSEKVGNMGRPLQKEQNMNEQRGNYQHCHALRASTETMKTFQQMDACNTVIENYGRRKK